MKNVQLEEITIKDTNELSTVIENVLNQCKDTQIFISDKLFNRLLKTPKSQIIWGEAVLDSIHYNDKIEKAFYCISVMIIKDRLYKCILQRIVQVLCI